MITLCQWNAIELGNGKRELTCVNCGTIRVTRAVSYHRACTGVSGGKKSTIYKDEPHPKTKSIAGTKLKEILGEIGIKEEGGCGCGDRKNQMNDWDLQTCRENRNEIIGWLKKAASEKTWGKKLKAGTKLISQPWFNPIDPYGSIVDEAIRRAELEEKDKS
jgi:hypothetical protein